jgi:hypothetical protein
MSVRTEYGFRTGAIEATSLVERQGVGVVRVTVGDLTIEVLATPKGRRAYVTVLENGKTNLQISVRRRDRRWWQP